ncbi:hypothetical protein BDV34DRAFT_141559 [Aspergillus parasiticus]|uniref:Uncharacterized protein n=1 Tax=Aspergillus parasiticus TaxID=5067 RepID=A0A5N6DDH6_ASPPA|nr:hypothetical protein BDV34DRAFT_141559 [Aspergillus parasiticus]
MDRLGLIILFCAFPLFNGFFLSLSLSLHIPTIATQLLHFDYPCIILFVSQHLHRPHIPDQSPSHESVDCFLSICVHKLPMGYY